MPDPYRGMHYAGTSLAHERVAALGLTINDAVRAVRNYTSSWPALKEGQRWYHGSTSQDVGLDVLIQLDLPSDALIITVYKSQT